MNFIEVGEIAETTLRCGANSDQATFGIEERATRTAENRWDRRLPVERTEFVRSTDERLSKYLFNATCRRLPVVATDRNH